MPKEEKKGLRNGTRTNSILSADRVKKMIKQLADGARVPHLMVEFGVTESYVYKVMAENKAKIQELLAEKQALVEQALQATALKNYQTLMQANEDLLLATCLVAKEAREMMELPSSERLQLESHDEGTAGEGFVNLKRWKKPLSHKEVVDVMEKATKTLFAFNSASQKALEAQGDAGNAGFPLFTE